MVRINGGEPVIVPTRLEDGYKLKPEDAGKGDHAAHQVGDPELAVEPVGAAYTRDELKALTDVLVRHPHVWVLSDDMYEHLVYGDFDFTTPVQIEPALKPRR